MDPFPPYPLRIFLKLLAHDGISVSVGDLDRMALVFRTGGKWDLARLKNTLTALLAKDEEQQKLVRRRFEEFFHDDAETDRMFAQGTFEKLPAPDDRKEPDVPRIHRHVVSPTPHEPRDELEAAPETAFSKCMRWILPGLMIAAILFSIFQYFFKPTQRRPPELIAKTALEIRPFTLEFGTVSIGEIKSENATLSNSGTNALVIREIEFEENDSQAFRLTVPALPMSLLPEQTGKIEISFGPANEGTFSARLRIVIDQQKDPKLFPVRGSCAKPAENLTRLYRDVPYVAEVQYIEPSALVDWKKFLALPAGLLAALLLYILYLRFLVRGPTVEKPSRTRKRKGHLFFHPGKIGAKPEPRLDNETLAFLADSMGYFKSGVPGKCLDVAASVVETLGQGGIPFCIFKEKKQIRTLLILEDENAEALEWDPISVELDQGMRRFGAPVIYGRFSGSPEVFVTPDGRTRLLEDYEDQRRGILLLMFTDGKSFYRKKNVFALERIARWPMAAWMQLNEARFREDYAMLAAENGLPVFPATKDGLTRAVGSFMAEQGKSGEEKQRDADGAPQIERAETHDELWLEHFLGDALPWARDCAWIQPITVGLAGELRKKFHPQLAPERIERLFTLPNTTRTAAGIRFSKDILRLLRRSFLYGRTDDDQKKVLEFILERVDAARPKDEKEDSLAMLSWEALRERVNMELSMDDGLKRFAELLQTPLADSLSDSLADFGFPEDPKKIPLRVEPETREAKNVLRQVKGNPLNLPSPVTKAHRVVCGLLLFATSIAAVAAWTGYRNAVASAGNVETGGLDKVPARLVSIRDGGGTDRIEGGTERIPGSMEPVKTSERAVVYELTDTGKISGATLPADHKYELTLYGSLFRTVSEFETKDGKVARLVLGKKETKRPCVETYENAGLSVECCAGVSQGGSGQALSISSWKQRLGEEAPGGRAMSVGLEIVGDPGGNTEALRRTLLSTGSVDAIYRVRIDGGRQSMFQDALEIMKTDIGPWIREAQLILWSTVPDSDSPGRRVLSAELPQLGFVRTLELPRSEKKQWMADLQRLLETATTVALKEEEVLRKIAGASASGNGAPIVLVRASSEPANEFVEEITGMVFVKLPGGEFRMGSPDTEDGHVKDEGPVHTVTIDSFWMGKYEVTNGQYRKFKKNHNSGNYQGKSLDGDDQPVARVSWNDAMAFVDWLNGQERYKGKFEFFLPSETQWEYACRAGTDTARFWGENPDEACKYANARDKTSAAVFNWSGTLHDCEDHYAVAAPVNSDRFQPNPFGLFHMLGNVWEWCRDEYDSEAYGKRGKAAANPVVQAGGSGYRVFRGGSWLNEPALVRCADRGHGAPGYAFVNLGFRLGGNPVTF